MVDKEVKITSVKDVVGFDAVTLLPSRYKQVTFMIGTHGPFTLTYPPGDYTQQRVQQDIQREVDTLRGLGVLPAM